MEHKEIYDIIKTDNSNSKKNMQIYYKLVEFYKKKYTYKDVSYIEDVSSICCDIIEVLLNEGVRLNENVVNNIILVHEKWFQ